MMDDYVRPALSSTKRDNASSNTGCATVPWPYHAWEHAGPTTAGHTANVRGWLSGDFRGWPSGDLRGWPPGGNSTAISAGTACPWRRHQQQAQQCAQYKKKTPMRPGGRTTGGGQSSTDDATRTTKILTLFFWEHSNRAGIQRDAAPRPYLRQCKLLRRLPN